MREISSVSPLGENHNPKTLIQNFFDRLIAPSPKITEPDRRRQAALLSSFLLGTLFLSVVVELGTMAFIEWEDYTGYRQTIVIAVALGIIYGISRTHHVRLAALLTVIVASAGVYYIGLSDPRSVLGGFFDFMILPLWLGSLYLRRGELTVLIFGSLLSILLFPSLTTQVTLNEVLVGPFSFVFATSILLVIIRRHRNRLEEDRRTELIEKEQRSLREAARAEALLRVAERLNAQLDLETLLVAISEEVTRALDTPVSLVTLYDPKQNALRSVTGTGISPDLIKDMPPLPRAVYDQTVEQLGEVFSIADLQKIPSQPYLDQFVEMNMRSIALATMAYEHELIGSLNAVTLGGSRDFTGDELMLLQGLADQAALAIINTRLYKDARRRLENLQALRAIDVAIASNHDLRGNLEVLLDKVTGQLNVDAAVFLLLDGTNQQLEFAASRGFHTPTLRFTRLRVGEGIAGRAAQQRQVISIRDLRTDPQTLTYAPSLAREGFASYYATPLITQGNVMGVLEIFHRSPLDPDQEWLDFLNALAGQAAIAIENTTLFEDLQRTNDELLQAYDSTIEGWSHALDLRDKETEGHTQRVTMLTMDLARAIGFDDRELRYIRWGALLHDIGKMGVPDRILLKEGPLTDDEWILMRRHPVFAHEMLRSIRYLYPALDIPYCHHEKWDGTGYPRGLKGEEIPLAARIFAVVDVWDALTSDRPYRPAWTREKTLAHIREGAGSHFDPQVVKAFIQLINDVEKVLY